MAAGFEPAEAFTSRAFEFCGRWGGGGWYRPRPGGRTFSPARGGPNVPKRDQRGDQPRRRGPESDSSHRVGATRSARATRWAVHALPTVGSIAVVLPAAVSYPLSKSPLGTPVGVCRSVSSPAHQQRGAGSVA